jgi:hypothetical protein
MAHSSQFFLPDDAGNDAPVTLVERFLTPVPEEIRQSLSRVIPPSVQQEIGIPHRAWVNKLAELLDEVRLQLASEVDILEERRLQAFQARRSNVAGTSESLTHSHTSHPVGDRMELSRDLTSAIYEYAPGSEIVAGECCGHPVESTAGLAGSSQAGALRSAATERIDPRHAHSVALPGAGRHCRPGR